MLSYSSHSSYGIFAQVPLEGDLSLKVLTVKKKEYFKDNRHVVVIL